MAASGKFITIEGGEGTGKSTLIEGLASWLHEKGISPVKVTREPGGTIVADQIRNIFAKPPATEKLIMEAELMLVSAGRVQHVEHVVRPTLAKGGWVISDRFVDSTRIYQGELGGIDSQTIEQVIALSIKGLEADLTFVMDCPVEIAQKRLASRKPSSDGAVRYDEASREFHQKLRDAHLRLAKKFPQRIQVIDASKEPSTCLEQAKQILTKRFGL